MKQVASLRYGVIFKKAFSQPDIFKAFVKDFLGIELNIDQVEMDKSFDPPIGNVDSRFDLFAIDKQNRVIVDILHEGYSDHYDRFLYSHLALVDLMASSQDARRPLKVFTLVVLTSGDRHKVDMATIDFDPKDRNGNPLNEIGHKVLYVCPKYVADDTPEPYREWLLAITDSLDEEVNESAYQRPEIKRVFELITRDLISPKEYARMKEEYSLEQLQRDKFEQGRQQKALEIARNLLAEGIDPAIVAKTTKLSPKELATLSQ
jgi:hypothetical protein